MWKYVNWQSFTRGAECVCVCAGVCVLSQLLSCRSSQCGSVNRGRDLHGELAEIRKSRRNDEDDRGSLLCDALQSVTMKWNESLWMLFLILPVCPSAHFYVMAPCCSQPRVSSNYVFSLHTHEDEMSDFDVLWANFISFGTILVVLMTLVAGG